MSCNQALAIDPEEADSWNGLGNLLKNHLQRYDETEQAYRQAIAIDPRYASAYNNLDLFYYQQQRHIGEATELARKAVALAPDNLYAAHTLATLLLHQGEWHEAYPLIQRLIREDTTKFHEPTWQNSLTLFREAVRNGYAHQSVDLLDKSGAGAYWRPLREALAAIAKDDMRYLNGIAPEVREPALKIVEKLTMT